MMIRRDILIMFVAMSLIPLGDTAGKLLSNNFGVSPFFISWARFATGALVLLPFVYRDRQFFRLLMDKRIIARGLAITGGITSILYSFTSLPITTGFSILFIAPLIGYFLSVIFLKEQITRLRTGLVIGGFIGVLMVAQPSVSSDRLYDLCGHGRGVLWLIPHHVAGFCAFGQRGSTHLITNGDWHGCLGAFGLHPLASIQLEFQGWLPFQRWRLYWAIFY